jgi:hypothetical protein
LIDLDWIIDFLVIESYMSVEDQAVEVITGTNANHRRLV